MMDEVDVVPAIPLWIDGHAYLTVAPAFHEVRNAQSGEVLRRTPLCDASVAQHAVAVAQAAAAAWAAQAPGERDALLVALADALSGYASHFAALLAEETGAPVLAATDVAQAVALLRGTEPPAAYEAVGASAGVTPVTCIVGAASAPMYGALRLAVPVLRAGGTVIVKPDPATPSALYALAELTARCGFPGGVFNIVHGDAAIADALRALGPRILFA
jgi:succinate-semialdehyde dehydrogenase / glutarate-semialdehyde dehydrogenase